MELLINIFTTVDEIDPHNRKPFPSSYRDLITFRHIAVSGPHPTPGHLCRHHYEAITVPSKTFYLGKILVINTPRQSFCIDFMH